MGDRYGFKPRFELTLKVLDITHDFAPGVGRVIGKCIGEINEMARLSKQEIETQMALTQAEPTLHDLEDAAIQRALEQTGGNKTKAAQLLGVSIRKIYRWQLKKDGEAFDEKA